VNRADAGAATAAVKAVAALTRNGRRAPACRPWASLAPATRAVPTPGAPPNPPVGGRLPKGDRNAACRERGGDCGEKEEDEPPPADAPAKRNAPLGSCRSLPPP